MGVLLLLRTRWFWCRLAVAMALAVTPVHAASLLINGSFDESGPDGEAGAPKGWEVMVLGTAPTVIQDAKIRKDGKYAIRMSASLPTLAGVQQVADVEAGKSYVLRGWVKTDRFEPQEGANMFATLLVIPVGEPDASKSTQGPNTQGSTDWNRLRLEFKGPPQGKVFIFCTFCGERNATGTVWFDGLELLSAEEAPPEPATSQPTTSTAPASAPASRPASRPTSAPASQPAIPATQAATTLPATMPVTTQVVSTLPATTQIAGTLPAGSQPQRPSDLKQAPTMVVSTDSIVAKPVNQMMYGHFIESGFGRQVDRMWSEMLFNRGFEAAEPLKSAVWEWLQRKPGDNLTTEAWYHNGYEENPWYLAQGNPQAVLEYSRYWGFHQGLQAAAVRNSSTDKPALLVQDGLVLRAGISYTLQGTFRSDDATEFPITVYLFPEKNLTQPIVAKTVGDIGTEWKTFETVLANPHFSGRSSLAFSVPPGKGLRLDGLSMMPSDHVRGWRKDVVEAIKRIRPRIIRFPGGCFASFYNWRDGVGPVAERLPRVSEYWGGVEYNDVGTAEFVGLCREVGAQPLLCVNVMTASTNDAADWVAYCNAGEGHPMGSLRRAHGYPEAFAVRYWELDNEPYRKYGPIENARRAAEFAREMKRIDPSIQIVMAGYELYRPALAQMLAEAGQFIDLVSDRGTDETYLLDVLKTIGEYNAARNRAIRLCNTEWLAPVDNVPCSANPVAATQPAVKTLQNRLIRWGYAMNVARQLLAFQRLGGDLVFTNFNNVANTWGQNVIECPKDRAFLSATGRVFELLAQSPTAWPLKIKDYKDTPDLAVQIGWDERRQALVINVVNGQKNHVEVPFDLSALKPVVRAVDLSLLYASSPAAFNSPVEPGAINRDDTRKPLINPTHLIIEVPPYSVTQAVLH